MNALQVELCPETGICSIIKADRKVDLLPDEVAALRDAGADRAKIAAALAASDSGFAAALSDADVSQIAAQLA